MAQKTKPTLAERFQRNKEVGEELTDFGQTGQAGFYEHPESKQTMHTRWDPLLGDAQSEAALRVGFVRIRDSKPGEIKELATPSLQHEQDQRDAAVGSPTMKGVMARLDALEGENSRLRSKLAKEGKDTTELSQSAAIAAADANTAERGTDNSGHVTGQPAQVVGAVGDAGNKGDTTGQLRGEDDEKSKPLEKQDKTELLETAKAEGVEGVTEEQTNKEIRMAIEANRA